MRIAARGRCAGSVFGAPDAALGERVVAVVVRGDAQLTAKQLRTHASRHLADFKVCLRASNALLEKFRWCLRLVEDWCRMKTMESVLESHRTRALEYFERSIFPNRKFETAEIHESQRNANERAPSCVTTGALTRALRGRVADDGLGESRQGRAQTHLRAAARRQRPTTAYRF